VVTKGEVRWLRSDLGTQALTDAVAALRCGLDAALWDDEEAAKRCRGIVTGEPQRDAADNILSETLPLDLARAHALYQALFGQVEDLIRGKHLLIVPSGPLTQLPFQVLVTAEAKGAATSRLRPGWPGAMPSPCCRRSPRCRPCAGCPSQARPASR
jgi:hypothetical protein